MLKELMLITSMQAYKGGGPKHLYDLRSPEVQSQHALFAVFGFNNEQQQPNTCNHTE